MSRASYATGVLIAIAMPPGYDLRSRHKKKYYNIKIDLAVFRYGSRFIPQHRQVRIRERWVDNYRRSFKYQFWLS
ncbi:hypothetical protein [Limnofasciculus baicalensis]|uniref:hypothetical protein n=1 Tax=Limnofasciculus baicalensis TaxID=3064906 RepID=UPI00403A5997